LRQDFNDKAEGIALGTPFFRNVSISLNFLEESIEVFTKTVTSPIAHKDVFPSANNTETYVIPQNIESTFMQYTGDFLIGTPAQGDGKKFSFSTNTYYSVIPDTSVTDGWFNKTLSSTYDNLGETTKTI